MMSGPEKLKKIDDNVDNTAVTLNDNQSDDSNN